MTVRDEHYDVVIVGGAVTGSSIAYHLANDPDFRGTVLVVEQDPSYRHAASALSAGSIRQQFATAINIQISRYGIDFLRRAPNLLAIGDERPDLGFHLRGYLFLATEAASAELAVNYALQRGLEVAVRWMTRRELAREFPWLTTADLAAGCLGLSDEGWFDGYSLMQAFRRKARALGVEYRRAKAIALERTGRTVARVRLDDGGAIACGALVNAAGTGAPALARSAGIDLPIAIRKRTMFPFACKAAIEEFPILIAPGGLNVRPEGSGFICGAAPPHECDQEATDFEVDYASFEADIWPRLAERVAAFAEIKPGPAWAGHFDLNTVDHNAIVGVVPGWDNFYLACGFSGHGLQQSPAVGRGIAELVVHGGYRALDLSPLGLARLTRPSAIEPALG